MYKLRPYWIGLLIVLLLGISYPASLASQSQKRLASSYTSSNPQSTSITSPDFSITAHPSMVNLTGVPNALVNLTLTSLNGFQGNITLSIDSFPGGGLYVFLQTGFRAALLPGQSVNATLFINTPSDRSQLFNGEKVIYVSAGPLFSCLHHLVTIDLTNSPAPAGDFTLSANPTSLTFPAGDYLHYSTITVFSDKVFNGTVFLQWFGGGGGLFPQNFRLHPGETGTAQVSFALSATSCTGIYSNILIATGGSASHAVIITVHLTDPTVSTIYFNPSGYCCRPVNSTITVYVNLHIPSAEAISGFDVRINYTNPATLVSKGVLQAENLNYSSGIFQNGVLLIDCIDRIPQYTNGCPSSDQPIPGQLHLAMALLGSAISGPFDRTLFSIKFKVTGNGTSIFLFDRVGIVNIRTSPFSPNLLNPEYIPVLEKMGAYSSQGPVAIFDYQPSQPSGSPAQRVGQPVIFNALESFTPNGVSPHIQSFTWNFGDGPANTTAGPIIAYTYNLTGSYTVSLKINDTTGQTAMLTRVLVVSRNLGNLTLTAKNLSYRPVSNVGVALYNTTSQTQPYTVLYTNATGIAEFDNLTPGTYTLTLTNQTFLQESISETIRPGWTTQDTIYLESAAPSVSITSINPYPANTGTPVTVAFSIYSSTALTGISINWGDGTTTQPSPTATSDTHTYPSTLQMLSRIFTINVTVTNVAGQGYALAQETVNDRPPTVTVTGVSPSTVNPGRTTTMNFTVSDPDGIISLVNVTWGDGSTPDLIVPIRSRSMCQNMSDLSTSECTLPVGALIVIKRESTSNIQVPPTSYSSLDCPGVSLDPQGTIIVFYYPVNPSFLVVHRVYRAMNISGQIYYDTKGDANACDDGLQVPASDIVGIYQYTLGSSDLTTIKSYDTHTYSKAGSYTIGLTATDDSGSQSYTTTTETIIDQPPTLTITHVAPTQQTTGTAITLTFDAKDPDGTVSSININWGDGSPPDSLPGSATTDTHSYTKAGSYTIIITATDNSGSSTQISSEPLVVNARAAPASTILGLGQTEFYAFIAIAVAVIAAASFLSWRRIRK